MTDVIDLNGAAGGEQPPRRSAKVITFRGVTVLDLDPEIVLEELKSLGFEGFVYVGYDKDGDIVAGSTYADGGTVLWLIETLKHRLMDGDS